MKRILNDNKKREKGSIYSLVAGSYLSFAAAVLVLAFLAVNITYNMIDEANFSSNLSGLISNEDVLKNERYDKLKVDRFAGKKGYIEILDENANVIYCSKNNANNTYKLDELEYIPRINGDVNYFMETVIKNGEVTFYVLNRYSYEYGKNNDEFGFSDIIVLDKNRNVLYSSFDFNDDITEKELSYLADDESTGLYVQQHEFENKNGEKRYMIIHADYYDNTYANIYRNIYLSAIILFLLLLTVLVIVFVLRTTLAVRKPIGILNNAMNSLGRGERDIAITYSGPKEFVQIVDTFNEMQEKLLKSEEEREKLEKERQKMLADISHDLRTPITVIQGYSRAVSDGLVAPEDEKKYLDTISKKADGLSELINTFYEYSKLEHPEFQLVKERADICEYFREYIAMKYEELELAGFSIDIDIPEEKMMASFDEHQLKRVFENIISNSVKSNSPGTSIYAGIESRDNKVIIHLGDNGSGIPENIKNEIFKPFVVGDDARSSGTGTGLGLSIAKLIIEAHGGSITLLDDTLKGYRTMFEITIV